MNINKQIVKEAERFVTYNLAENLNRQFLFHDISHTTSVGQAVTLICNETGLDKHEKRILQVAAWFHDIGYTQRIDQHEGVGALLAETFLKSHQVDETDIEKVKCCIIATHYPQYPLTLSEMILYDADMVHLADKNYLETAGLLRQEWVLTRDKVFTDAEWIDTNIKFMSGHSYHTLYCQEHFEEGKQKNIRKLKSLQQSLLPAPNTNEVVRAELIINPKKQKKEKSAEFGRGVETLFRIASGNHMRLSGMADNKAHILLSINSIIISVVLSVLAKKLTEASYLVVPTLLLLAVCLVTIVFAVLTTRPKVSKRNVTIEEINNQEVNLLFFGNFHSMEPSTYEYGIREMMLNKDYLYKSLTKDVYWLGKVLAVKYRYLNIGYMIFMYGLIVSVIAFGISFFISQ